MRSADRGGPVARFGTWLHDKVPIRFGSGITKRPFLLLIALLILGVDIARLFVLNRDSQPAFTDAFEAVVVTAGAIACTLAARRSCGLIRALWGMMAGYFALNLAADLHDFVGESGRWAGHVFPTLEFFGWCTYLPLALMIFLPIAEQAQPKWKWVPLIDFAQVAIALSLACFQLVYMHHVNLKLDWTDFGKPEAIRNLLICSGLLLRILVEPSAQARAIYRFVGICFTAITLSKLISPAYEAAVPAILRPAAFIAIAIFAANWQSEPLDPTQNERQSDRLRMLMSLFAAGTLMLVWLLAAAAPQKYRILANAVSVAAVALFIVRTALAEYMRYVSEEAFTQPDQSLHAMFSQQGIGGNAQAKSESSLRDADEVRAKPRTPIAWARYNIGRRRFETQFARYGFALLAVAAGTGLQLSLSAFGPLHSVFVFYYPAILLVALWAGLGPGILATVLAVMAADYWFIPPSNSFEIPSGADGTALLAFAGMCIALVILTDSRAKAQNQQEIAYGELKLFRALIDESNDAVKVMDPETLRFLDVNERACTDLGYSRSELLSMSVFDINPAAEAETPSALRQRLQEEGGFVLQTLQIRKDGSVFPAECSLRLVNLDRSYILAVSRNISDRQRAEEALRESEDRYRDLVEHSEDLVCTHDLDGKLLSANPASAKLLGYNVPELLKTPMRDFIAPEFRAQFDQYLQRIKQNGTDSGYLCVVSKAGKHLIWEYQNSLRTEGVAFPIVRGIAHDVTEAKRAEEALRRSEERYRILFEKTVAAVGIITMDGVTVNCNDAWARFFGFNTAAECRGGQILDHYPDPAQRELLLAELRQNGVFVNREWELRRNDGSRFWVLLNSVLLHEADGSSLIQSTMFDITERKRAEEALRRSEENYRNFVAQSSEGIFRQDVDAPIPIDLPEEELVQRILHDSYMAECNEAMVKMYGLNSIDDFVGRRLIEFVTPNDPSNLELTREYIRSGFRIVDRESYETDVQGNPKVFRNSMIGIVQDGKLVRTWGIQRDVTDQMKLETAKQQTLQALQESEGKLAEAQRIAHVGHWDYDMDSEHITWSEETCRIYGLPADERVLTPKRLREMVPAEDQHLIDEALQRVLNGGKYDTEHRLQRPDGEVRFIHAQGNVKRDESGRARRLFGTVQDITERKRAHDELHRSERRLQLALQAGRIGAFEIDLETGQGTWTREISEIWGTPTDMDGDLAAYCWQHTHPEDLERVKAELHRLRQASEQGEVEFRIVRPDQTVRWIRWLGQALRDPNTGTEKAVGVNVDITERKRAEEETKEAQKRLDDLVSTVEGIVWEADANTFVFTFVSRQAERILGYPTEQWAVPGFWVDHLHQDDRKWAVEFCVKATREGRAHDFEYRMIAADGRTVWLRDIVSVVDTAVGKRLRGIMVDITQRKWDQELIRQNEERFRVALKDSPITVFNQDLNLRYTWIYNPQLIWQGDLLGRTDDEIIGPEKAAVLKAMKCRVLASGKGIREEVAIPQNSHSHVFDVTIEPLFDGEKNVVGITAACADIARLREMADRVQESRDRLAHEKSYLEGEIRSELGFEEIIGQSPTLREVLKKARVVAPTDSTVLLLGETGTGKELVARSVHALSSRRNNTFVKLNCAAVPSGLLESELFGHEKGAFTGAITQKIGRIELADQGTLFLDEIGELPPELQPKLLRVLQDREFERLGGVKTLRVDVRIVSATNRDLRQDVEDKKFREDLFYRLNVFPIELPPLRERRDDIFMLVQHFIKKHAARMGKPIDSVPEETMRVLRNWHWPGNVRELENVIERMVIMSKGSVLAPPPSELCEAEYTAEDNLTEMEREHILRVLRETNGVLSGNDGAASRLGLKRTTLQSMIKRLGIQPDEYRSRPTGTYFRH